MPIQDTMMDDPSGDTPVDEEGIGQVDYSQSMFDEHGDIQNAGDAAMGYNPSADPNLGFELSLQSKPEGGSGYFTRETLQDYKDQLTKANRGNLDALDFDNSFVYRGGNTYDLKLGSDISGYLHDFRDAQGNRTTIDKAVYLKGDRKGQPLSRKDVIRVGRNILAGIDESGGGDETQGDSESE